MNRSSKLLTGALIISMLFTLCSCSNTDTTKRNRDEDSDSTRTERKIDADNETSNTISETLDVTTSEDSQTSTTAESTENQTTEATFSTDITKPTGTDGEFVREVDWASCGKYKNWATDVNEIIPEGYTGNMIYGISETDPNKTYMVYGRDPEWMDTFGYCYFNNDFVFLFKLTKPLKGGDRLYYTTVKDGVENNEPRMLVYDDDFNDEFVLRWPDYEFTDNGSFELRLWEDKEMTHLLGYVEVIKT